MGGLFVLGYSCLLTLRKNPVVKGTGGRGKERSQSSKCCVCVSSEPTPVCESLRDWSFSQDPQTKRTRNILRSTVMFLCESVSSPLRPVGGRVKGLNRFEPYSVLPSAPPPLSKTESPLQENTLHLKEGLRRVPTLPSTEGVPHFSSTQPSQSSRLLSSTIGSDHPSDSLRNKAPNSLYKTIL